MIAFWLSQKMVKLLKLNLKKRFNPLEFSLKKVSVRPSADGLN